MLSGVARAVQAVVVGIVAVGVVAAITEEETTDIYRSDHTPSALAESRTLVVLT